MELLYEEGFQGTVLVELPEQEDSDGQPNQRGRRQKASDARGNALELVLRLLYWAT